MKHFEELYTRLQALHPLSDEAIRLLDEKFMLEFNYNSNHLEGNTLTYGQTKLLLMFGEISGEASMRDLEEMKAHNVGLKMMQVVADEKQRPLTESLIRELNQTILVQNYWKDALTCEGQKTRMEVQVGEYKTRPNSVTTKTGERFDYASPEETSALMSDLVRWYNEAEKSGDLDVAELAALLHYRFIRIHPFDDGNGRIARLLVNYVLRRHDYPMIVVPSADKRNYLDALHHCDVEVGLRPSDGAHASLEQIAPFVKYVEHLLEHALALCIEAAQGEDIEEDDDFEKKLTLLDREIQHKKEIEAAKRQYSVEEVRDVLDRVYYPIVSDIYEILLTLGKYFHRIVPDGQISTTFRPEDGQVMDFAWNNKLSASRLIKGAPDPLIEAKSLWFSCSLGNPKEPALGDLEISLGLKIGFLSDRYDVELYEKTKEVRPSIKVYPFKYGVYPSAKEVKEIVNFFKNETYDRLKKSIKPSRS